MSAYNLRGFMDRKDFLAKLTEAFKKTPVVVVYGPPECGKTSLARRYAETQGGQGPQNYFDLSSLTDLQRLAAPQVTLSALTGLITLDEIQRFQNIFPILRALVDGPNQTRRFLILSSASKARMKQPLETLDGRVTYLELGPFGVNETSNFEQRWVRGGFPHAYLSDTDETSWQWREEFTRMIVERYLPNIGIRIQPQNLMRFWTMLAHFHGDLFNASELGRSMGLSHNTIQSYADALSEIFMIRQLKPWHENITKRQVKSHKIYFRDTGIFHHFIGVKHYGDLLTNPKLAASWEGLALEEIIRHTNATPDECYFWATQSNAKLDLLIVKNGKRIGYNIQYAGVPKMSRALTVALDDLKLDFMTVIYPGEEEIALYGPVRAVSLRKFLLR